MMFIVMMVSLVESRPDLNLVFATEMRVAGGYGTVTIIREKRRLSFNRGVGVQRALVLGSIASTEAKLKSPPHRSMLTDV